MGTATVMATSSADRDLALDLCERDFESVLERMLQLRLDSPHGTNGGCTDLGGAADQPEAAGTEGNRQNPSGSSSAAASGAEWVEALVSEMAGATSMDDARCRAARVLEAFQGSVAARVVGDKERVLEGQNAILKKAVVVQHRRHLQDEAKCKELQVQVQVQEYRERVRQLEVDNYALTMHLRTAQAGGSMSGSFHPEVF